jgi:hypothetical protein
MNRRAFLIFAALMLICAVSLQARGGREKKPKEGKVVQVTGLVRLVGSSPFSELVISSPAGEWYIIREEMDKLHDLQQQTVTVEGEETVTEMRFANGKSAGTRRTLRNIRLISP